MEKPSKNINLDYTRDEINEARQKKNGGANTGREEPGPALANKKPPPYLSGIK